MPMSPEKWNALKPGDAVTRSFDGSSWKVASSEPCPRTIHGYSQVLQLYRTSDEFCESREGLFFRDNEGKE